MVGKYVIFIEKKNIESDNEVIYLLIFCIMNEFIIIVINLDVL